ncbi:Hypothetical protein A7982_10363 [Minicystis rosea]|nr:Hypothetical protein A7982_10363 [Minicystis rosea]
MKKRILAGMAAFVAFSAFAPIASADPPKEQSYEYKFTDDKLLGDTMGAQGAKITVLKVGRRDRLLRPRVQFVQEMLKSVENM